MLRRSEFFGPSPETPVRDPLRALPTDREVTRFAVEAPAADVFSVATRRVTQTGSLPAVALGILLPIVAGGVLLAWWGIYGALAAACVAPLALLPLRGSVQRRRTLWLRLAAERVTAAESAGDLIALLHAAVGLGPDAEALRRAAGDELLARVRSGAVDALTPAQQESVRELLEAAVHEHLGKTGGPRVDDLLVALLLVAADTLSAESLGPVLHVERLTDQPRVREAAREALRQRGIPLPEDR